MARPLYESHEHIAEADTVARMLERVWNCRISNALGAQSPINRLAFRNSTPLAWIEIKCRSTDHQKYPTYMLSLNKIRAAKTWNEKTSLPVYLVVSFSDAVAWINLVGSDYETGPGGRQDRFDPKDQEECAYFNMKHFYLLERETVS